jgi:hypothetical protein
LSRIVSALVFVLESFLAPFFGRPRRGGAAPTRPVSTSQSRTIGAISSFE